MYAVIKSGGKQYRVAEGETVRVEKLGLDAGSEVEFKEVLLVKTDDSTAHIGRPHVEGAAVRGTVQESGQGKKVLVFKYKKKKQYRRTHGHRQHYSAVRIDKIHV